MAIIDVNFHSTCLNRMVTYKAIIPTEHEIKNEPYQTLYLLHGYTDNHTNWLLGSQLALYATKHRLAIIMPAGENSFYIDDYARQNLYGKFIGDELVTQTRQLFHLSHRREDTFIGGLSMGGYGAVRNGLKYHQTFSHIIGLSSAFILNQILNSTPNATSLLENRTYFESLFGDLNHLIGSENDYKALIIRLKNEQESIPKLYLACGTEDFLIEENRDYHQFLKENNIPHTYIEDTGKHDWNFWDTYIKKAIEWLPLYDKSNDQN